VTTAAAGLEVGGLVAAALEAADPVVDLDRRRAAVDAAVAAGGERAVALAAAGAARQRVLGTAAAAAVLSWLAAARDGADGGRS
jgi:hypothetical protein